MLFIFCLVLCSCLNVPLQDRSKTQLKADSLGNLDRDRDRDRDGEEAGVRIQQVCDRMEARQKGHEDEETAHEEGKKMI